MTQWMLVRHAKSDWNDSSLGDKERPLNQRGRRAAVLLGQKLLQLDLVPERILCSTSLRTIQTLQGILQSLCAYSEKRFPEILYIEQLYLATAQTIQQVTLENHGGKASVLCIGHNPGIEVLASELGQETLEMKTAHLILFETNEPWEKASNEYASNEYASQRKADENNNGWRLKVNLRGEEA
jgi:phosphohistidine phosphatase SixA